MSLLLDLVGYHTPGCLFFSMTRPPPRSPLFPYTTLFRSVQQRPEMIYLRVATWLERRAWLAFFDEPVPRKLLNNYMDDTEIGRAHSELQSPYDLVCRLLLEKKKKKIDENTQCTHCMANNT